MADFKQRTMINVNQFFHPLSDARWVLLALLIIQTLFITWSVVDESLDKSDQQSIINLERSQIKQILIEKKGFPVFEMQRSNEGWVVTDSNKTKLSPDKVNEFLTKLLRIQSSWPIANTKTSIQDFQVAATNYLAKIELTSNTAQHVTLFLGLSPGVNSTFARISGSNDVYRIPFNTLDLSTNLDRWREDDRQTSPAESGDAN